MQAGLVDGKDIIAIAANLQKLIDSQGLLRAVTFPLVSFKFNLFTCRVESDEEKGRRREKRISESLTSLD